MMNILKKHSVFFLFLLALLWLMFSVVVSAYFEGLPVTLLPWLALVFAVSIGCYVATTMILPAFDLGRLRAMMGGFRSTGYVLAGLSLTYSAIVITHFVMLGGIPFLRSLEAASEIDISIIRQNGYFDLPGWMRYASDYALKSIGPALLLLTCHLRSRWFFFVLAIGVIYSCGLLVRSLPLIFMLPLCAYFLFTRQWWQLLLATSAAVALVLFLTNATVPSFRDGSINDEGPPLSSRNSRVLTILERSAIVPGRVMHQWFENYREPGKREDGCGYRVVASLAHCPYVHIPTKLYSVYYPERVAEGMKGSLNAVFLMTDYANFGFAGFIVAGMASGFLFGLSRWIYGANAVATTLNVPLILSLMETNLLIAVNSGSGWLLTTLIYVLIFHVSGQRTSETNYET